jgi:three-Cys-motif partner protein
VVAGTPIVALQVDPPFRHHYFIDLAPLKVGNLKGLIGDRPDVDVLEGDCNRILLDKVFPNIRYEDYRRGLCLLDPYGLHLNWEVVQTAGQMGSLEVFINFPVADMNRNVLWLDPEGVDPEDVARMTAFWGDDSWRRVAYSVAAQGDLFREPALEKTAQNEAMAEAYPQRLIQVAGFSYVPPPLPMRNTKNAIVYYLFFASRNNAGGEIVKEIFDSYREKGY